MVLGSGYCGEAWAIKGYDHDIDSFHTGRDTRSVAQVKLPRMAHASKLNTDTK